MNERFAPLLALLKGASSGTKGVALLVGVGVVALILGAGWLANRPDFELLYSELDDQESSKVLRALSEANIAFEVSQPPGPFHVYVDRGDRHRALMVIATAGALDRPPAGIPTPSSGFDSIFVSSAERQQMVRKREWEETERILEELDFILKARVGTSETGRTPLRMGNPMTASVALTLRGATELNREQAKTVASLVRFRLGVREENLVIADQAGHSLWDGQREGNPAGGVDDWLDRQLEHDRRYETSANDLLTEILGAGKARVKLVSTWDTEQRTMVQQTSDPESAVAISEESVERSTPQVGGSSVGGAAGMSSNLDSGTAFGVDSAGVPNAAPSGGSSEPAIATDSNTRRQFVVDSTTTQSVKLAPVLSRLSVSLFLDEAIPAESEARLAEAVKASVGFDETRGDRFESLRIAFATAETDAAEETEAPAGPSPMIELVLERGVEIVSAVAFLFVLMRSLRGSKKRKKAAAAEAEAAASPTGPAGSPARAAGATARAAGAAGATGAPGAAEGLAEAFEEDEVDVEATLRRRVDELVDQSPEELGRVVTRWITKDRVPVGGAHE